MGRCKLWFVFLLWLMFCSCYKETQDQLVKTIGKDADFTPVCKNITQDLIVFMVCKIRTERSGEEECRLLYRRERAFETGCDSRFSLVTINETMFLQLNNLTPEDVGNYMCECSYRDGSFKLQLNITVERNEVTVRPTETSSPEAVVAFIGVSVLMGLVTTGVVVGIVCRNYRRRRQDVTLTTELTAEVENIEPYSVFMQKENELYLTSVIHTASTNNLHMAGTMNMSFGAPL